MKDNTNKNIKIIPVVTYDNFYVDKSKIYKKNKIKSGIYRLNNLVTGKSYVGSSKDLSNRFSTYYSLNYIKKKVKKDSSIIYNSILKYGYDKFSLDILEYCELDILIEREQYYMDLLKPEYNILKKAGSRLGFKHTEKTKLKISIIKTGIKHDISFSKNLSKAKRGKKQNKPRFINNITPKVMTVKTRLKLSESSCGVSVKVLDKNNNLINKFSTITSAAKHLGVDRSTIGKIFRTGISYDDYIYKFEAKDIRIWVYDCNKNFINTFNSINKVSE